MQRCGNCGMYGNKKQVKYKIAQSPMTENVYAFLCCKNCNEKDALLCVQYGGKKQIKSEEDLKNLDYWEPKFKEEEI